VHWLQILSGNANLISLREFLSIAPIPASALSVYWTRLSGLADKAGTQAARNIELPGPRLILRLL
jgi:hypothetical protein